MQQGATQGATHRATFIGDCSDYLHRRRTSKYWYVRKRIPSDLVGNPILATRQGRPRKELTRSTGKVSKHEAAGVAAKILAEWEALFALLRGEEVEDVAAPNRCETTHQEPSQSLPDEASKLYDYLMSLIVHRKKQEDGLLDQHRTDYFIRNSEQISPDSAGQLLAPLDTSDYLSLYEAKAIELLGHTARARNFAKVTGEFLKCGYGQTLGEVLDQYLEYRVANGSRTSSINNVRKVVALFARESLAPMGLAMPFKKINKQHARAFVNKAQEHWPGQKTCSDNISTISTVFRYGVRVLDAADTNPFEHAVGLLPKAKRGVRMATPNEAYDNAMLGEMLPDLAQFSIKGTSAPTRILLPAVLLALYTGMRVEEMCQLKKDDIRVVDGVRAIFLPYSKSQAGIREIPLNRGSELVVDWLIANSPDSYLLPGLVVHDDRRSKKVSDRFNRWKTGYFPDDSHKRRYTLHSFRSTAITALDRADVPDEYISLLVGHEDGRKTLAKTVYSSGKRLRQLHEPALQIDYGDELFGMAKKLLATLNLSE